MKLATLKDGSRDGKLVVVSRDLTRFTDASFLVKTLQAALDDWTRIAPHLATMAESLETGAVPSARFHEHDAHSPLPRAYQRIEALAPAPNVRQESSDSFTGPRDPMVVPDDNDAVECGGEVAVMVDDVPRGATADAAQRAIRLVLLGNGAANAAFSPVAVTPDELGAAWKDGKVTIDLVIEINGKPLKRHEAGLVHDFPRLIAQAAKARGLSAGTIVGSGSTGTKAAVLRRGDTIRIETKAGGHSLFGAIEQTVQAGDA